jgi:3'-phosphoadenosine 5'-phosphosulfate sulfotransferase (PAPS reductase)/FAD synthetase
MVYLDTRVGLPFQRLYVEQLADAFGEQLWSLRTHEHFEDRVAGRGKYEDRDDSGPPGAALHSDVQNELKGRQRELLARGFDNLIYVTGIRAEESHARSKTAKADESRDIRYVKPAFELTKKECAQIVIENEQCPINPAWVWNHFTDCGCLANGDPSELDAVEEKFPAFASRLREYEEAINHDGLKSVLGWDGLTPAEKNARKHGSTQMDIMDLCGGGCQRKRKPAVSRALMARLDGATVDEAVDILYE